MWCGANLAMLWYMAKRYFGNISFTDPGRLELETAELLGFMLSTRVDGKSPEEYINTDSEKIRCGQLLSPLWNGKRPLLKMCAAYCGTRPGADPPLVPPPPL